MKNSKRIPASALFYLITGLLLVTATPILTRHSVMPNVLKGFLTGIGMMLEVIAIIIIQRSKRSGSKTC